MEVCICFKKRASMPLAPCISLCVGMRIMPRGHGGAGATGADPTLPPTFVYISLCAGMRIMPRGHGGGGATGADPTSTRATGRTRKPMPKLSPHEVLLLLRYFTCRSGTPQTWNYTNVPTPVSQRDQFIGLIKSCEI
jgi:hypothetical protein